MIRRFTSSRLAREWYEDRAAAGVQDPALPVLVAIVRGDPTLAEKRYREAVFPDRWRANLAFFQGHYLLLLQRRDRILEILEREGLPLPRSSEDPLSDLVELASSLRDRPGRAKYILGHVFLAMEWIEGAEAMYREALAEDPREPVDHDDLTILESVYEESLARDPGNPEIAYGRARLREFEGHRRANVPYRA